MKTFKNIDSFNNKLQHKIRILELNVEAKSYEDLKKDPKRYRFSETENFITFILKERRKGSEELDSFIVFRGSTEGNDISLRMFSIYKLELKFMSKESAKENW